MEFLNKRTSNLIEGRFLIEIVGEWVEESKKFFISGDFLGDFWTDI